MPHKLAYIRYKLVSCTYTTHNSTLWRDAHGKWLTVAASGEGSALCTDGVIHFYDHPVLAVLFNPLHAEIDNPRLLKLKTSRPVAHDGLKGGCKSARAIAELAVPSVTITQRVEFAIRVALRVYNEPSFRKWAYGWLTYKEGSPAFAAAAVNAAYAAAANAAFAAANASDYAAVNAAASAVAAANAAANAAYAAASVTFAAAYAANAAYAAAPYITTRIFKSVLKTMKLYKLTEEK